MGKEYNVQDALKLAIKAEKDSMDFYVRAASAAKNERAKKVLEMLAAEEATHVKHFFNYYKGTDFGDLQSFLASPVDTKNPTYMKLEKAIDARMGEQAALELALVEEKSALDNIPSWQPGWSTRWLRRFLSGWSKRRRGTTT